MKMLKGLSLSLFVLASGAAYAGGTWTNVTVTAIYDYTLEGKSPSGLILVTLSASSTGSPACATTKTQVVIDTTTSAGSIAAETAHLARSTGATIPSIVGAGSCGLDTGIESMAYIESP